MKLSVIILAKEDDLKLKRAVESVSFADEVVVVKEKLPVKDFSKVRNSALGRAKREWVLFVDSDEIVTKELMKEIQPIVSSRAKRGDLSKSLEIASSKTSRNDSLVGYYIKRKDCWGGRWLEYGETGNIKLLRLARKDAGQWVRPVHEAWKINGETGELNNPVLHYSHDSVEEMVEKLDRYSEMEAEYRVSRLLARWQEFARSLSPAPSQLTGRGGLRRQLAHIANLPTSLSFPARNFYKLIISIQMIFFPIFKFVWNYFFRLGFLDGMEGFIHAGMMSGHSFLVRAKLLMRYESTNSSE